jgi:hypothetical protein
MSDAASIDYGGMMHDAMRGLIRRVLAGVAEEGLPGKHHFFISFDTRHPGVAIAPWLRERYPTEMTIVLQHWFEDLVVEDARFSVTLNFGDQAEALVVPYDALRTFVDPSVEFGLRFEGRDDAEEDEDGPVLAEPDEEADDEADPLADAAPDPEEGRQAEVVSLDKFRKR